MKKKNSETAKQDLFWRKGYDLAWLARREIFDKLVAQGENHSLRLISLFEQFERKNLIDMSNLSQGKIRWEEIKLSASSPSGTPPFRKAYIDGKARDVPYYFESNYTNFFLDFLQEVGDFDALVELGCGYGRQLFKIFHNGGPKTPYYGGELSDNGLAIGKLLAQHTQNLDIEFHKFDYINPDLSWLPEFDRIVVFTIHSIEQVNKINIELFRHIANSGKKVIGLHLEPFGFQIDSNQNVSTINQAEGFKEKNWNVNFLETLMMAQVEGILQVDCIIPDLFAPIDYMNTTSLAIWHTDP